MKRTFSIRVNETFHDQARQFDRDIEPILMELFPKCQWTKDENEFFSIGMYEAELVFKHLPDFIKKCKERGIDIISLTLDFEPFIKQCDFFFIEVADGIKPLYTFGGQAQRKPIIKKILGELPSHYFPLFGNDEKKLKNDFREEVFQKMVAYYIEARFPKGA